MPFAVTAALAVMDAVEAKVVTALTVRVWLAEVPRTVLPAAVRVVAVLVRVTPPVKVARPALSMVRRSTGCPLLLLVLPAVVVLNIKLPPVYPAASYSKCNIFSTVGPQHIACAQALWHAMLQAEQSCCPVCDSTTTVC